MDDSSRYEAHVSEDHTSYPVTMEPLMGRLDDLDASFGALRAEFLLLNHVLNDNMDAAKIFRADVLKRLDAITTSCSTLEKWLDSILQMKDMTPDSKTQHGMPSSVHGSVGVPSRGKVVSCSDKPRKRQSTKLTRPLQSANANVEGMGPALKKGRGKEKLENCLSGKGGTLGRRLFTEKSEVASNEGGNVCLDPSACIDADFECEVERRIELPQGMEVEFHPTKCMALSQLEIQVAAYVFATKQPLDEFLAKCSAGEICRREMLSLRPLRWAYGEVLMMVAARMTHAERGNGTISSWFLPPSFSQQIFDKSLTVERAMRGYCEEQLCYLDSAPDTQEERHALILQVATFVEGLLKDNRFHNTRWETIPPISTWTVMTPPGVARQSNWANCGVCVGGWMSLSSIWGDYNIIPRGSCGRMRLALDIVLDDYNVKRKEIISATRAHWIEYETSITI